MKKLLSFLLVFLVTGNMVFAEVSDVEKNALVDFYESTNGKHWKNKWDLKAPVTEWYGVKVIDDHVVEINLFRNNLMGPISESIGDLKYLEVLNLAFNNIKGVYRKRFQP